MIFQNNYNVFDANKLQNEVEMEGKLFLAFNLSYHEILSKHKLGPNCFKKTSDKLSNRYIKLRLNW